MSRARFPKPVEQYGVLAFFGRNIVITEGDEWKKHRKISAPAFSDVRLYCSIITTRMLNDQASSATTSWFGMRPSRL